METSLRGDLLWGTIPHLLSARAAESADRPAMIDVDRQLSFGELQDEAHLFARALMSSGVERGDRVAIWGPNRWRWVVAALGAHCAGASLVPVNTRYKGAEAAYILAETSPKALVMMERFLDTDYPRLLTDAGFATEGRFITVMMDDDAQSGEGFAPFTARATDTTEGALAERIDSVEPSDYSDILFTSGTTGLPKGVITDHGQNLHAYYDWSTLAGMQPGDRYAIIPPFFHAFGYKVGWLACLMHGMTMYPHAVLDVSRLLEQISSERIAIVPGPPALYQAVLDHPERDRFDLSSLRLAIIGAATIPPVLVRRMNEELGFERITTCYGLTEATGVATVSREDDPLERVVSTAGRAVPDVEVRVALEGEPPREVGEGEIVLRGYNILRGYFGSSEIPLPVNSDGWMLTGDIGVLDDQGYLRVTDRKKDMFIVGGFNAYPAEIEKAMAEHPAIEQVAVIGVRDRRLGEVAMAFVVPRSEADLSEDSLIKWCRERFANFKVPRRVLFVSEFPRNATGKVLKNELRSLAASMDPIGAQEQG